MTTNKQPQDYPACDDTEIADFDINSKHNGTCIVAAAIMSSVIFGLAVAAYFVFT